RQERTKRGCSLRVSSDEAKDSGGTEPPARAAVRGRGERVEGGREASQVRSCDGRPARDRRGWRGAVPGCGLDCGARQGGDSPVGGDARLQGPNPNWEERREVGVEGGPTGHCQARLGREKRSWGTAMRGWGEDQGSWLGLIPGCGEPQATAVGGCSYYQ
ncbi:hypothetical protein scyTo_0016565, partial [Scyliorhinus torazame]|nr:hypothetical protein [Scyliorhinus torazame]